MSEPLLCLPWAVLMPQPQRRESSVLYKTDSLIWSNPSQLCSFLAELWQYFVTDVTRSNHWKVTPGHPWVQMYFIRLMPLLCLAASSSSFLVLMPSSEFPSGDQPPPEGLQGTRPSVDVIRGRSFELACCFQGSSWERCFGPVLSLTTYRLPPISQCDSRKNKMK